MARHITISDSIKQEIAERVVEQAHPGYDTGYLGEWYIVDGARLMHRQRTAPWDPWHDGADVISVEDLVFAIGGAEADRADFDAGNYDDEDEVEAAVMFALDYIPDSYDAEAWDARLAVERGW